MKSLVQCESAVKYFGKVKALDNIGFNIEAGQIIGLLGENGSGKTSLLNCMAGLSHLDSGDIKINDISVRNYKVKKELSYMPAISFFQPKWSVKKAAENFEKFFADFNKEKNKYLLDKLNIDKNTEFGSMSSGTLAKAKMIFTLSREAKLYLLDEPFANIDLIAREEIYSLILSEFNPEAKLYLLDEPFANIDLIAREEIYSLILSEFNPDTTIILSTHFINEIEMLFDRVILMKDGRAEADINVEEYKEKNDKSVVEFYREIMKR
jgi:ABC-2 type transport system ATP-binding protein